jgi:protein-tyrosine phosphatase
MIDIHSHVLPGLDDGAGAIEEAVEMLRIAEESGTTDLVATPHANLDFRFEPEEISRKLTELEAAARVNVRLHWGCDFHLYCDNVRDALENPSKYTVNGKSYLLVEFPDLLIAKNTPEVFAEMREAGIVPIITHPERNFLLHRRLDDIASWIGLGCLVQVTALSFTGRFGGEAKNVAHQLMKRGMVHFVASDAHDATDRTPRLDEAYRYVSSRYGAKTAEALFIANPRAVLTGDALPAQPPLEPPRKWYKFWAG